MHHMWDDQRVLCDIRLGLERVPGRFPENRRARSVGHPADPRNSRGVLDHPYCGASDWHLSGCACRPTASPLPAPSPAILVGSFLTSCDVASCHQDKREIAPNRFVAVPPLGGRGRYPCFVFAFVALVASIWGLLSNEYDAHQSTERGVWIAGLCVWGLMMLVLTIFIAEKLLSGTGAERRAQARA